jgi:hypothetical protein
LIKTQEKRKKKSLGKTNYKIYLATINRRELSLDTVRITNDYIGFTGR